jgi:CubicO group peptidase (beta-lactamase class C family)
MRVNAIEKAIDQKGRNSVSWPLSRIVKDDKVIYMKGLGVKDFEHKLPVTPDTSRLARHPKRLPQCWRNECRRRKTVTRRSPKKYLPYLKLDPDADAKITLRDLLSHRSGLNRTDLAMVTGH